MHERGSVSGWTPPSERAKRLRARLTAEWPHKIAVLLGLSLGICLPYFVLQRVQLFPERRVPPVALDAWIPFEPAWIGAYLSIAALVPLAPLLADRREDLGRYARGLAGLCGVCFVLFLLLPVAGPRPVLAEVEGAYAWLVSVDRPFNSMPSLHAGLALYSLLFIARCGLGWLQPLERRGLLALGTLWVLLILYATLATRQHWALDLPAGLLVAWAARAWAWRTSG